MTEHVMRAKMRATKVEELKHPTTSEIIGEEVTMNPVGPKGSYPEGGHDEDNSYAIYSPSGELKLSIRNPALFGKIKVGDVFYQDFTRAAE